MWWWKIRITDGRRMVIGKNGNAKNGNGKNRKGTRNLDFIKNRLIISNNRCSLSASNPARNRGETFEGQTPPGSTGRGSNGTGVKRQGTQSSRSLISGVNRLRCPGGQSSRGSFVSGSIVSGVKRHGGQTSR